MDKGAWKATVHGIAKSQTQLSNLAPLRSFSHASVFVSLDEGNSVNCIRTTFTFCNSNTDLLGRGVGVGSHCFLIFLINCVLFDRIALEFSLLGNVFISFSINNQSLLCVGFCL